ncbi:MAG: rod shape-determining protein [Puniceicoccales bacterium]|jgi:rod shape-determining protein MreB|nr:rod shape-determining protein [Puniceicoccales bacterium]
MKRLPAFFSNAIGIDLGTANTLVYVKDRGIVMREPSVVAIQNSTRKPIAVGNAAKQMLGRTPGTITAIRPMKDGVIADFEISEHMLRYFIGQAVRKAFFTRLTVMIAVPYGITAVEKRAVLDSAYRAGANEAETIAEPIASALGVGLPVGDSAASMIVDIGGGTTEVAILSIGDIVHARSIRVGGDEFDTSIINYVKRAYNLIIGERTAEEIKIKIGSAVPLVQEMTLEVKGRDAMSGLPRPLYITSQEVREALMENLNAIIDAVRSALERCPPELASDLVDRGIALAGGGSLLRGIDKLVSDATGVPVFVGEDPMCAVVNGTGVYIEDSRWRGR